MISELIKRLFVLLFILSSILCEGQTLIEINPPNLIYENENLFINFDLSDKNYFYEIDIEITNSDGSKIHAIAFSGDIGSNIKPGKNKSIIWDLEKDNIVLDEAISVRIVARLLPKSFNKSNLIIKSTVWPGWGQTNLTNGKPYWIIGFAGTACIAGSYIYNQKSLNSYDKYKDAISVSDSDKYYNQATEHDNTSKILAYSAIGIWAANIIWVSLMPNDRKLKITKQKLSLHVSPYNLGELNSTVSFGISLNL